MCSQRVKQGSLPQETNQRKKYNTIVIGCGNQGCMSDAPGSGNEHKIISFAHAVMEHPGFELCGFYDKDREKSIKAIEAWEGAAYCCINHAIEIDGVNVAVVATNDDAHYDILKQLAEYPLKLVIVEKPICTNIEQAREIVELYKDRGINLAVNYTRRCLPYYNYLRQYGTPTYATCAFNKGWLHTASHGIDFFNMIGAEKYRIVEIPTESYRVWDLKVYYENHVFSEVRVGDMPVWEYYNKSHWHIVNNIYKFLEGEEPLKCKGEQALHSLEICFELMERQNSYA